LTDVFIDTISCSEAEATLLVNIDFRTDLPLRNFTIRVSGNCNDSTFLSEKVMFFVNAGFRIKVVNPKLWWPRGYGEANLYDVKVELLHEGQTVSERKLKIGIRTVKLDRTDISTVEHPGRFQFIVNGTSIFCRGANWIPADAFHSRDIERIPEILEMVAEMGCNMLRCWGGGTYEPHQFYDICDRTGIMIWQDFSMALYAYPQDPHFLEIMREEAEWVIKELRNHSCIALWCGDNECDSCAVTWHREYNDRERIPENNRITREVFPELIRRHDPSRSYLPSSPYIAPEAHRMRRNHRLNVPERHSYRILIKRQSSRISKERFFI
jgi:beta-mannosidase